MAQGCKPLFELHWNRIMQKTRRRIQILVALLANSYLLFPWKSPIYQGALKKVCFQGLNCYSCPAALFSCPLGSLQNFFSTIRPSLSSGQLHFGAYVIGSLGLVGSIVGRMPCGWFCPFGLIQEFLFRIPAPKVTLWRPLRFLPYFFLLFFVIILPLAVIDAYGYGQTWFCKYVCPAGTLEAGIPLILMKPELRRAVGWLFVHKVSVLIAIIILSIFISRFFCRTICPLGAIFGLFNRLSWFRLKFDKAQCVECKACYRVCPTDVSFYNLLDNINTGACIRCLRCYNACPAGAVCIEFNSKRYEESDKYSIACGERKQVDAR